MGKLTFLKIHSHLSFQRLFKKVANVFNMDGLDKIKLFYFNP